MNYDYIYWTFSAAAQSISAFVAFLLTGYALVHALMEAAKEKDDSLEEIHAALRSVYHRRLTLLAWLTGAAIVLSLFVVYLNRPNAPAPNWLVAVVTVIDLTAVIWGLAFVVCIVNPSKYQIVAERVLKQGRPESGLGEQLTPAAEFFSAFIHLERLIREYLQQRDVCIPGRGAARAPLSFRQMMEALLQNEKIDRQFYEELMEISSYRNLVFHGHIDQVDLSMLEKVRAAALQVERLGDGQQ